MSVSCHQVWLSHIGERDQQHQLAGGGGEHCSADVSTTDGDESMTVVWSMRLTVVKLQIGGHTIEF